MVPVPVGPRLAPLPTSIAAVVLVDPVIAEKAVPPPADPQSDPVLVMFPEVSVWRQADPEDAFTAGTRNWVTEEFPRTIWLLASFAA